MEQKEEDFYVCLLCNNTLSRQHCERSRQWTWACQCPQPSHRECLEHWAWICEVIERPPKAPSCPQCGTLYRLKPANGVAITALESIAFRWYPNLQQAVQLIVHLVCESSTYSTCGLLILSGVYGFHETWAMVYDMHPLCVVAICHNLPLTAVIINDVPWEEYILRSLQRCSSLPVLGKVMPQGDLEFQPPKLRSILTYGSFVRGMLLTFFAKVTGSLLFRTKSPSRRFLLGGAVFLAVRGIFYMYYRQKTFLRQHSLAVANYVPSNQERLCEAGE